MLAVHTFWSKPFRMKNNGKVIISDIEMLVLILSALEWKKHNGKIIMVTDTEGYQFFEKNGILNIWDVCQTDLDNIKNVDYFSFWAAGKLYALDIVEKPCVMLDTDMIIWKNIKNLLKTDVVVAHQEEITDMVYPSPSMFKYRNAKKIVVPQEWDFSLKATNTAFLYIKDVNFAKYYVNWAFKYIESLDTANLSPVQSMCFVEQRLLPICAKEKNVKISELLNYKRLDEQDFCTHLWGAKKYIYQSDELNEKFCRRCMLRIKRDYPSIFEKIFNNQRFRRYIVYERKLN